MKTVTFKEFKLNYEQYYNEKLTTIRNQDDMSEVIFDLYNIDELHYEINYEKKLIELY